jgi:hypothetical protein
MKTLRPLLLSFAAVALLAGTAVGKPHNKRSFEATDDMKAVHTLTKQIAATELAQALNLDGEQKTTLKGLITDIVAKKKAMKEQRSADAPELRALLEDYLVEVQTEGQPSQATADALASLKADKQAQREAKGEEGRELHDKLQDLLDEDQKQALMAFEPSVQLGPGPEGRKERRMERRERRGDRGERTRGERGERSRGERGQRTRGGEDFEPSPEMKERHEARMQHRKARHIVRQLLLSEEMLGALN